MTNVKEILNRLAQDAPKSQWGKKIEQRKTTGGLKKSIKVAIKLNRILRQKGMKQKHLAELLGVSAQQVNKILKGRENLTLDTIERIESAIGVDLITVLREDEKVVKTVSGEFTDSKSFKNTQVLSPEDNEFDNYSIAYTNNNKALVG
jgi:transcriptional regulator with XRE-family HTH domain